MGVGTGANTKKLRKFGTKRHHGLKKKNRFPGREIKMNSLEKKAHMISIYEKNPIPGILYIQI